MNPASLFLASLACFFVHLLAAQAQRPLPSVHLSFDLSKETYGDLLAKLQRLLKQPSVPPYEPDNVQGRFVLGPRRRQFRGPPLGWIMIDITGDVQEDKTTLAIANDDLYLLGFSNSTGHWYILDGKFSGLPGAITLPFTESYRDLVGGRDKLPTVPLGKQSAIEAVKILANCDFEDTTTKEQVKQAMVRFVVMISEALRFPNIRNTFSSSQLWQKQTFITEEEAEPVLHWGNLSALLVIWKTTHTWPTGSKGAEAAKDIGVNGPLDALKLVDFLLRPKDR